MNKRSGFTLIELMLSVVILSILSGSMISVIGQNRTRDRAKDAVVKSNLEAAVSAIDSYYYGEEEYPLESEDGNPLNNELNTSLSTYLQQWPNGLTYKYNSTIDVYAVIARRVINTNYYKYISSCEKIIECESAVSADEEDADIMGSVTFCTPVTSEVDASEDYSCLLVDDSGSGGGVPIPDPDPDPDPPTTLPNGSSCTLGSQCTSTFCVDGVCCNNACTGSLCQTCGADSIAGAGTCGPANATSDPDNECTASSASTCDGNNAVEVADGNCSGGPDYSCKKTFTACLLDSAPGTGGTITYSGEYTIHKFTSNGTFVPPSNVAVEYAVVAGGGGGGSSAVGGGGGAGGMLTGNYAVPGMGAGYSVTIGQGGNGGGSASSVDGSPGGNSSIIGGDVSIIAVGGGGGGSSLVAQEAGNNGGSGGGGGAGNSLGQITTPGSGTSGQGYDGGHGYGQASPYTLRGSGGGGGAGGTGGNAASSTAGTAGPGASSSITGSAVTYATGGAGAKYTYTNGVAGAANTGNGGGGSGYASATRRTGGKGGSGVVIVRYLTVRVNTP